MTDRPFYFVTVFHTGERPNISTLYRPKPTDLVHEKVRDLINHEPGLLERGDFFVLIYDGAAVYLDKDKLMHMLGLAPNPNDPNYMGFPNE